MAFIKQTGKRFQVRQGNNNELLQSFSSRKAAEKKVTQLHKDNHPKAINRGKTAAKKFSKKVR